MLQDGLIKCSYTGLHSVRSVHPSSAPSQLCKNGEISTKITKISTKISTKITKTHLQL
jgi:hypothetical protein